MNRNYLVIILLILLPISVLGQAGSEKYQYEKDGSVSFEYIKQNNIPVGTFDLVIGKDGAPKFYEKGTAPPQQDQSEITPLAGESDANWDDRLTSLNSVDRVEVNAMVVDGSGNLYVGGDFQMVGGQSGQALAMWNGSSWSTFNTLFGNVQALEIIGSTLYVGGSLFEETTQQSDLLLWDGSSWSSIGSPNGIVRAIEYHAGDDEIYIGGQFTTVNGQSAQRLAIWDGLSWREADEGVNSTVYALAYSPFSDLMYVGGVFQQNGSGTESMNYLASYDPSSDDLSQLLDGVGCTVFALEYIDYNGLDYILTGGCFGDINVGGSPVLNTRYFAAYIENSASWGTWTNEPFSNTVYDIEIVVDEVGGFTGFNDFIYIGGYFTSIGANTYNKVVRWEIQAGLYNDMATGVTESTATVRAIGGYNGGAFVGGDFVNVSGGFARRVANWDQGFDAWSTLGTGDANGVRMGNPNIEAVTVVGDNVYIGGFFNEVAGMQASNFAAWNKNTDTWTTTFNGEIGLDGQVRDLNNDGSNVIVGGSFSDAGGNTAADYLALWNGSTWGTIGGTTAPNGQVLAIERNGTEYWVTGYFGSIGGIGASQVAYYNGASWQALGPGIPGGEVNAVKYDAVNDLLYVGGQFNTVINASNPGNLIAQWNPGLGTWAAMPGLTDQSGSFTNYAHIYDIEVINGNVYAGGFFTANGDGQNTYVAEWDGANWTPIYSVSGNTVRALESTGTDLFLTGGFQIEGVLEADYVAKYNTLTSTITPLGTGLNGTVSDLWVDNAGDLFLGGYFNQAGGTESIRLAVWDVPTITVSPLLLPTNLCAGSDLAVSYTTSGSYESNNQFIVQISDISGDFANGQNIGSISSTTDGTIVATIPGSLAEGSGYRIRVVSSAPDITSADNGSDITINCTVNNYYWVGGSGNWSDFANHWATTSGGSTFQPQAPTQFDNVFFDENSFTADGQAVTIDGSGDGSCRNMDWSGVTEGINFDGNGLLIYGSLNYAPTVNPSISFYQMNSVEPNAFITTNGVQLALMNIDGTGIYTLVDQLDIDQLYINNGTFSTGDQTILVNTMATQSTNTGDLILNASTINIGSSWNHGNQNIAISPGTSTISMASGSFFAGGDATYYNLVVEASQFGGQIQIQDNNTYEDLIVQPGANVLFESGTTHTSNNFTLDGQKINPIIMGSINPTLEFFLTSTGNDVNAQWLQLSDCHGGNAFGATYSANNSIDNGGNSGWLFTAPVPQNYYWVGGSGNWSDPNHWATSSGGSTFHTDPPAQLDDVFFDANSFPSGGAVSLDLDFNRCNNMDWTGATNSPGLAGINTSVTLEIHGSVTLISDMNPDIRQVDFVGSGVHDINTAGNKFQDFAFIDFIGTGTWNLQDILEAFFINFRSGTLNTNDNDITLASNINFLAGSPKTLNLGSSTLTTQDFFNSSSDLTVNAGTSTIIINEDFGAGTFQGAGFTFHNLEVFNEAEIYGANTFSTLTLHPGAFVEFEASLTQTVGTLVADGTRPQPIAISSTQDGVQATISQATGTVNADNIALQDNNVTGGAVFNADEYLITGDALLVTGWTFGNMLVAADYFWVGDRGDWSDAGHWATTSGGSTFHAEAPGALDNVFFDGNSFSTTGESVFLDIANPLCNNMEWQAVTNFPTLLGNGSNNFTVLGDLTLSTELTVEDLNEFRMVGDLTHNVTVNGADISSTDLVFDGGGTYNLQNESFEVLQLRVDGGTLMTNGATIQAGSVSMFGDPINIQMSNSQVTTASWAITGSATFDPGSSTIILESTTANPTTFNSGNKAYNVVTIRDDVTFFGSPTITDLVIEPGATTSLDAFSTTTIAGTLTANGTATEIITIKSNSDGNTATLSKAAGTVTVDFVHLQDNTATGGATFNATNSADLGNVTGWNGLKQFQTITFNPISDLPLDQASFALSGTASSGLTPIYSLATGDASISGSNITVNSSGLIGVTATQAGDGTYAPAVPSTQYFFAEPVGDPFTLGNFKEANTVIGQADFTGQDINNAQNIVPFASSVAVSANGVMAVGSRGAGRVLLWNSVPTTDGANADVVVGKPDFTNANNGTTDALMTESRFVDFSPDGSKLVVSEDNRILIWNTIPTTNGAPADVVIGQPNFTSNNTGLSETEFNNIWGIHVTAGGQLIVCDANNDRVLIFNSIPTTNNAAADVVIGQEDFVNDDPIDIGAHRMDFPIDVTSTPQGQLLISDFGNDRVLIYNSIPTTNGASADFVIGQDDFNTNGIGLAANRFDGPFGIDVAPDGRLAIGSFGNHRVLIYNQIPTSNGASADMVLGQPNFTTGESHFGGISARSIDRVYGLEFDPANNLMVAGRFMNRVMFFGAPDQTPPSIDMASSPDFFTLGMGNQVASATVSDNVAVADARVFYRGVSEGPNAAFTQGTVNEVSVGQFAFDLSVIESMNEPIGLVYYFEVVDGYGNVTTNSNTGAATHITVPADNSNGNMVGLTAGTAQTDYRIISVPYNLDAPGVASVFDELGTYNPTAWRIFSLVPGTETYNEFNSGLSSIELGKGYFLLSSTAPTVNVGSGNTPRVTAQSPHSIDLVQGWNLIGNPYNFNLLWSDIMTANGDPSGINTPVDYTGSFVNATQIDRYGGVFVFTDAATTLDIPVTRNSSINGRNGSIQVPLLEQLSENEWDLSFSLSADNLNFDIAGLGMRENAKVSFDKYDGISMPRFIDYLELNFEHPEFFANKFRKDVVPVSDSYKWEFTIETNLEGGEVDLSWSLVNFPENGHKLVLLDIAANKIINLNELENYSFETSEKRHFLAIYGDEDFINENLAPDEVFIDGNYPNPFAESTNIRFGLPDGQNYRVRGEIYDGTGRLIRLLVDDSFNPGFYEITWDGTGESGNRMPEGVYFYVINVNSGENTKKLAGRALLR